MAELIEVLVPLATAVPLFLSWLLFSAYYKEKRYKTKQKKIDTVCVYKHYSYFRL